MSWPCTEKRTYQKTPLRRTSYKYNNHCMYFCSVPRMNFLIAFTKPTCNTLFSFANPQPDVDPSGSISARRVFRCPVVLYFACLLEQGSQEAVQAVLVRTGCSDCSEPPGKLYHAKTLFSGPIIQQETVLYQYKTDPRQP